MINGQIAYLQSNPTISYSYGTTALLTCNPNFSPIGSTNSYCSGGMWSPSIGKFSRLNNLHLRLGSCQYLNAQGTLGGVPTFGETGAGVFTRAGCSALPTPSNGQIVYSTGVTGGLLPSGTTANLICTPGFTITSGMATVTCQVNATAFL